MFGHKNNKQKIQTNAIGCVELLFSVTLVLKVMKAQDNVT